MLQRPKRYDPLTGDVELDLIRRWWGDGDLVALDELVGAHRPMVVTMAKNMWRGTTPFRVLVEYGMLGLRIAAQPPRPSKTKKGETVGFDAGKGRFSTYARDYAKKEMRMAVSGRMVSGFEPDILPDDFEHKTTATVEDWLISRSVILPAVSPKWLIGIFLFLVSRRGPPEKCQRKINLWSLGELKPRKVRMRNYLTDRVSARELANKDLYYRGYYEIMLTFGEVEDDVSPVYT